jgi:hypothetical protein
LLIELCKSEEFPKENPFKIPMPPSQGALSPTGLLSKGTPLQISTQIAKEKAFSRKLARKARENNIKSVRFVVPQTQALDQSVSI